MIPVIKRPQSQQLKPSEHRASEKTQILKRPTSHVLTHQIIIDPKFIPVLKHQRRQKSRHPGTTILRTESSKKTLSPKSTLKKAMSRESSLIKRSSTWSIISQDFSVPTILTSKDQLLKFSTQKRLYSKRLDPEWPTSQESDHLKITESRFQSSNPINQGPTSQSLRFSRKQILNNSRINA